MTTHLVYRVIELLAVPVLVLGCAAYCIVRLAPEMVSRWLLGLRGAVAHT